MTVAEETDADPVIRISDSGFNGDFLLYPYQYDVAEEEDAASAVGQPGLGYQGIELRFAKAPQQGGYGRSLGVVHNEAAAMAVIAALCAATQQQDPATASSKPQTAIKVAARFAAAGYGQQDPTLSYGQTYFIKHTAQGDLIATYHDDLQIGFRPQPKPAAQQPKQAAKSGKIIELARFDLIETCLPQLIAHPGQAVSAMAAASIAIGEAYLATAASAKR